MSSPQLVAALRRGEAATGDPNRLLRVLRDAEAGRAVTLVGIGASLTQDYGGVIGRDQDRHALSYMGRDQHECHGSCVRHGWLTHLAQHLAGGVPLAESSVSAVNPNPDPDPNPSPSPSPSPDPDPDASPLA